MVEVTFYSVLREVIPQTMIETSSDLIVVLAAITEKTETPFELAGIQDLAALEYLNHSDDSIENISYIVRSLRGIIPEDVAVLQETYRNVTRFFLRDYAMNEFFPLDSSDEKGMKIYAELCSKMHAGGTL